MSSESSAGSPASVVVTCLLVLPIGRSLTRSLQPAASLHGRTGVEKLVTSRIAARAVLGIILRVCRMQLVALRTELSVL